MYKRDSRSACVCASMLGTILEDNDGDDNDDGATGAALMGE